jgi:hypothetical protein
METGQPTKRSEGRSKAQTTPVEAAVTTSAGLGHAAGRRGAFSTPAGRADFRVLSTDEKWGRRV